MMRVDNPHGVFLDAEGRVVKRFANWAVGEYDLGSDIVSVEYVDGPAAHTRTVDWRYTRVKSPPVNLTTSKNQLPNDGTTEAKISMTLNPDADGPRIATLSIAGETFAETVEPGVEATEVITTTKPAGEIITVEIDGDDVQRATDEIEVVSA